jgi:hypothetical protein
MIRNVCVEMDVKGVINSLGGAAELARKLGMPGGGVGATAVRAWNLRQSIPAAWFNKIADVARREGVAAITVESLADLAVQRRQPRASQTEPTGRAA